jgi:hypothetical protein
MKAKNPASATPIVSNVVAIGRPMNGADGFTRADQAQKDWKHPDHRQAEHCVEQRRPSDTVDHAGTYDAAEHAAPPPAATPPPTPRVTSEAQIAPGRWDVERVRCSDLLGAAAAAAMFYYGPLTTKAGTRVIDVSQIDGNVRKVVDRCAGAPNITVPQAFQQALSRRR